MRLDLLIRCNIWLWIIFVSFLTSLGLDFPASILKPQPIHFEINLYQSRMVLQKRIERLSHFFFVIISKWNAIEINENYLWNRIVLFLSKKKKTVISTCTHSRLIDKSSLQREASQSKRNKESGFSRSQRPFFQFGNTSNIGHGRPRRPVEAGFINNLAGKTVWKLHNWPSWSRFWEGFWDPIILKSWKLLFWPNICIQ